MKERVTFYLLKVANTTFALLWSVMVTYVLVRKLGLAAYAVTASVIALGMFVFIFDLGLSSVIYHTLRSTYLKSKRDVDLSLVSGALLVSFLIAGGAAMLFTAVVYVVGIGQPSQRLGLVLLFTSIVAGFPSLTARATANALDAYMTSETIEAGRRATLLLLTAAMLGPLSFVGYGLCALAIWIATYAVLFVVMKKRYAEHIEFATPIQGLKKLMRGGISNMRYSAIFAISEFLIYNMPYYILAARPQASLTVVAFDVFFKCTRFAAMSYVIGSEFSVPLLTRAYHLADFDRLRKGILQLFVFNAIPATAGIVFIAVFGEAAFGLLLGNAQLVSPELRVLMVVMIILMLIQASCGSFLVSIGNFRALARRARLIFFAMTAWSAAAAISAMPLETYMTVYVAIYGVGAVSYLQMLRKLLKWPIR